VGLRERKRQSQRAAIIENSIALFKERGFEAAAVSDIAARCQISQATFFNYFSAKEAVLGHWACGQLEAALAGATGATDSGTGTVRPAIRRFARALAAEVERDRTFAAFVWPRVRLGQLPVPASAVPLIEGAQVQGELRRDVPAAELGRLLVGAAASTIARWLEEQVAPSGGKRPPVPVLHEASLEARLRLSLDLILDGARRRHERVASSAAARLAPADR
jgi:AcrR family transcriptional regulator